MITIVIDDIELYDNNVQEFVNTEGGIFKFEHSLEAIAKWEAEWKLPFLHTKLSSQQLKSYYMCMALDDSFKEFHLIPEVTEQLSDYMEDDYTATTFRQNGNNTASVKIMTSETIYSLMVAAQVPFECARWNVNRLLVLLRVISANQEQPKKMTRQEVLEQNRQLNEERKRKFNTKG